MGLRAGVPHAGESSLVTRFNPIESSSLQPARPVPMVNRFRLLVLAEAAGAAQAAGSGAV